MKVVIKSNESVPGVAQDLLFQDKAIHKLRIKKGGRKDFKFKDIKVSYLTGMVLRYSPLTQKKLFYLRYKYKGKAHWLKVNEFIFGHYGTLEVSEELLKLYKKYYDKKNPLTKTQYHENFTKIVSFIAQLIIAAFLCAVVIYSIF